MPDATLQRISFSDEGTKGTITIGNGKNWKTLELPWRENQSHISCIPPGTYSCILRWSERFNKMLYELQDVPDRQNIEIHVGNWAGDETKGFHSNVLGCIVLGEFFGSIPPHENQIAVLESSKALSEFMSAMQGLPFTLEIRNPSEGEQT